MTTDLEITPADRAAAAAERDAAALVRFYRAVLHGEGLTDLRTRRAGEGRKPSRPPTGDRPRPETR